MAKDEFYWSDLIGLTVINLQGEQLGEVDSLLETGANDVLVVKNKEQKTQCLVPFVMGDIVEKVDRDGKVITVNWGPWGEVGMAREGTKAHAISLRGGDFPLATAEAYRCLEQVLELTRAQSTRSHTHMTLT